jgi:hypothetical protein
MDGIKTELKLQEYSDGLVDERVQEALLLSRSSSRDRDGRHQTVFAPKTVCKSRSSVYQ